MLNATTALDKPRQPPLLALGLKKRITSGHSSTAVARRLAQQNLKNRIAFGMALPRNELDASQQQVFIAATDLGSLNAQKNKSGDSVPDHLSSQRYDLC